ncbi:Lrp/AsnC ligand binding domain-containing protein [Streptomyces flaveolus]|uniref:Lrp/AsnC ligand binding domain-containing protein n=1 Tax=Streptomyces flaveolus TaxID=67297 RepID=UPI0037011C9D
MVWLTAAPHDLAGAGRALAARPEVRLAAAVTGRTDLVLSVLCRTPPDPFAFLSEQVSALSGVQVTETMLTLRRVKTHRRLTAVHLVAVSRQRVRCDDGRTNRPR